jgi:hypothetical protein
MGREKNLLFHLTQPDNHVPKKAMSDISSYSVIRLSDSRIKPFSLLLILESTCHYHKKKDALTPPLLKFAIQGSSRASTT